ncbi:EVE domain-containing protein [Acidovorax sp. 56]|uniref:EVE domain-containing protein n=1 Tax=Acidovorax sp. 56 TaxID=2035205 RepID=UPI000C173232|nr:EVE domain-containing protein [Acidovorax sp. 56]PIF28320.1 EVE domain-containing protein [Acidovorax sp. 56]
MKQQALWPAAQTAATSLSGARRNWIAVASATHARRGCAQPQAGFMQVCHGKSAPLKRVQAGDRVAYYAPTVTMGGADRLQAFVSIGVVLPGDAYAFDMGGGFFPYRKDVSYLPAREAPIAPLLDHFEFVDDRQRWGSKFRFGLFAISDHDMGLIAEAMGASLPVLGLYCPQTAD